jgi:hypothetical protein
MIRVELDSVVKAPTSKLTLSEMINHIGWPEGATCATQEIDGEILFWDCDVDEARKARAEADLTDGLMPLIGIGKQVDSQYTDIDYPECACDWKIAVAENEEIKVESNV